MMFRRLRMYRCRPSCFPHQVFFFSGGWKNHYSMGWPVNTVARLPLPIGSAYVGMNDMSNDTS